jgi:protein PsiE
MDTRSRAFDGIRKLLSHGLSGVEYIGLLIIALATGVAMYDEVMTMASLGKVHLSDLLMMFLYLEVLTMISHYFRSGKLPVRFPLYIAMVALARYLILDLKEMTEFRMLAVSVAILLLTLAVLAIRYGHVRYPYREDTDNKGRPFVRE